jgi:hypothetical protein
MKGRTLAMNCREYPTDKDFFSVLQEKPTFYRVAQTNNPIIVKQTQETSDLSTEEFKTRNCDANKQI